MSDITYYNYIKSITDENLPLNRQEIDDFDNDEAFEPKESDWFAEEETRQDDNPN